jgi:hypothetical protein
MDTEPIRLRFKPDNIRLLLIGESPPASGKFFYLKSAMTTFTARAFERAHGVKFKDNPEFLDYFRACGCYLDDLSRVPVDRLPKREREELLQANVGALAQRIRDAEPSVVAVVLKRIEGYVRDALTRSGCTPRLFVLPFPGIGHQNRYIEGLVSIISEYISPCGSHHFPSSK